MQARPLDLGEQPRNPTRLNPTTLEPGGTPSTERPKLSTQTKFPQGKDAEVPGQRQQSQDAETPSRCRLSPTAVPTLPGGWERSAERPGAQLHPGRRHSPRGPWG